MNNRIKELRKQKKITQDELAKAVEVTRQTIISLENGKYNASLQLAYKISRYFGTNIEDVFIFVPDTEGLVDNHPSGLLVNLEDPVSWKCPSCESGRKWIEP